MANNRDRILEIISDLQLLASMSKIGRNPIPSIVDGNLRYAHTAAINNKYDEVKHFIEATLKYWYIGADENQYQKMADLANELADLIDTAKKVSNELYVNAINNAYETVENS